MRAWVVDWVVNKVDEMVDGWAVEQVSRCAGGCEVCTLLLLQRAGLKVGSSQVVREL